jgi:hypothetical protein
LNERLTGGSGYCAGNLIRVNEFKVIQIRPNSARSKHDLSGLKKFEINMILKGLNRGTTFFIGTSLDSK